MSDATIFYILAGILAGMAVIVSFIGIKVENFPGKAGPVVILAFVALIGGAITFSVLNGQHEEEVRAAELEEAGEVFEEEEANPEDNVPGAEQGAEEAPTREEAGKTAGGDAGGTVQLAASPTEIAYDTKTLTSKPGEVTIEFENPAAIAHDVAIEAAGQELAKTDLISESETTVSADLKPGSYTFLCTVPGHAEAGMQGILTVK
ncbi:MAG TPA: plastocyanin/azurin family copper-binding protein [Solirubrobacterales bacterium]